jgi:1-acyl-sn-glycerol-3-phosphate acyltransferase
MKSLWYLMVKLYVRTGFNFYFKQIRLEGIENVPRDKAVLFVANHQNALIDPLLIGAFIPRRLHFLTRADVFYKPYIRALLSTVNMLPIYRIRDGRESLSKNEQVFQKCYRILNRKGTVLIFPEGNHNIQRRVRVLSKGFTRIVFGALENYGDHELMVVPIGINYSNARRYASSVSLIVGEPIRANDYHRMEPFNGGQGKNGASTALKNKVRRSLKQLVTHIEDQEQHDYLESCFYEEEFLDPTIVNGKLERPEQLSPVRRSPERSFNFLLPLVRANSIFPLLIWKNLYPKIGEEEFIATYKFTLGITAFPIFYVLQSLVIGYFFGPTAGWIYLGFSSLFVYLLTKSR